MERENKKKESKKKIMKSIFWIGAIGLATGAVICFFRSAEGKAKNSAIQLDTQPHNNAKIDIAPPMPIQTPKPTSHKDVKLIKRCNKILRLLAKDSDNMIMLDDEITFPVKGSSYVPFVFKQND